MSDVVGRAVLEASVEFSLAQIRQETDKAANAVNTQLERALEPIKLTFDTRVITRQVTRLVSNFEALDETIEGIGRTIRDVQNRVVAAFRAMSSAKDAFRKNVQALANDFTRVGTSARQALSAIQAQFNRTRLQLRTQLLAPPQSEITALGRNIRPTPVRVTPVLERLNQNLRLTALVTPILEPISRLAPQPLRVTPIIDQVGLPAQQLRVTPVVEPIGQLEPQRLPVIPEVIQTAGLIEPIPVPIIPFVPPIALPNLDPIELPVKANTEQALASLQELQDEFVSITVNPVLSSTALADLRAQLVSVLDRLSDLTEINVRVRAEGEPAVRTILDLKKKVDEFPSEKTLVFRAQTSDALAGIRRLQSEAGSFRPGAIVDAFSQIRARIGSSLQGALSSITSFAQGGVARFEELSKKVSDFAERTLANAGRRIVQFGAIAGTVIAGFAVRSAANLEQLQVALKGVFPNEANQAFDKITEFARTTPFEIGDLTDSVIQLGSSMRFTVDESLEFLKVVASAGAAAGASSTQINQAVLALTQIQARSKLSTQELNQLSNALPNVSRIAVFEEIARRMGTTAVAVQDLVEKGLVPSGVAIESILEVMRQVPGAEGSLERQSKTLNGVISNLKDTFNLLAFSTLKPLIELFSNAVGPILNNGKALENLQKRAEAFGQTLASVVKQAIQEFGPAFQQIAQNIGTVFSELQKSGPQITTIFRAIVVLVTQASQVIAFLAQTLLPVVRTLIDAAAAAGRFLNQLGLLRPIISFLIARFLVLKGINLFQTLLGGLAPALQGLQNFVTQAKAAGTASGALQVGIGNLGTSLKGLLTPANLAAAALLLIAESANNANKKAGEAITAANKAAEDALNAGLDPLKAAAKEEEELIKRREAAQKRIKELGGTGFGAELKRTTGGPQGFFDQREVDANEKIRKEADKKLRDLAIDRELFNEFVADVVKRSGKSRDEVLKAVAEQGFKVGDISGDLETFDAQVTKALNGIVAKGGEAGTNTGNAFVDGIINAAKPARDRLKQLQDELTNTLKDTEEKVNALFSAGRGLQSAQKAEADALERIQDAQRSVTDARIAANQAVQNLNDLEQERARILRETISPTEELAAAERALIRTRDRLRDLSQEEEDIQHTLAALRGQEAADDRASLARDEERAQIALNRAIQAEKDLLAASNAEKQKTGALEINLAGLTLQQARIKLAAARASLAAQKQGQVATEEGGKTAQQIADDERSARLDVLDAEQALKDSQRARLEFERTTGIEIRENEERLQEIGLERADVRLQEQDDLEKINALRRGETTLAKELKRIDEQIRDAKRQIEAAQLAINRAVKDAKAAQDAYASAVRDTKIAEAELAKAAADVRGDTQAAAAAQLLLLQRKRDGLSFDQATEKSLDAQLAKIQSIAGAIDSAVKAVTDAETSGLKQVDDLKKLFDESVGDQEKTAALLAADSLPNLLIDAANKALQQDPTDRFALAIKDILLTLFAQRFSGFASGGVFQGQNDGKGIYRLAEYGKEAVLPLTRPFDMTKVLSDNRVLSPVLRALGTVTLPDTYKQRFASPSANAVIQKVQPALRAAIASRTIAAATATPFVAPAPSTTLNIRPQQQSTFERRQQMKEEYANVKDAVKEGFTEALKEAGGTGGGDIHVSLNSTGLSELDQRKIVNEVTRNLERKLGRG